MHTDASSPKENVSQLAGRWLAGPLFFFIFGLTAFYSYRSALADFEYAKNTPEALLRATQLAPNNAAYAAWRGELLEGQGEDPKPELSRAVALSPLDSKYLIRQAFRAEIEGDYAASERYLIDSAKVDHKANPRWALMNFYYRRGRTEDFWRWFTRTLEMSSDDVVSIYRLGWDMSIDGDLILSHIPNRDNLMIQYLRFLSETQRLDDARGVAIRVARLAPKESIPDLVAYCHRYAAGDSRRALPVWNELCKKKVVPFEPLDPEAGAILTNANLRTEPTLRAFDWRGQLVDGTAVTGAEDGGIRVELRGNQPEECTLLLQTVPLVPGKKYSLGWQSTAEGSAPVSGLFWELVQERPSSRADTAAISGTSAATDGHLVFTAAETAGELRLRYKRPLGTVRATGTVTVRGLSTQVTP